MRKDRREMEREGVRARKGEGAREQEGVNVGQYTRRTSDTHIQQYT